MLEEQTNLYYVDFKETGGVVHTRPTRVLPELVLTGKKKSELEIRLENYFRSIRSTLGEASKLRRGIRQSEGITRRYLFDLLLPSPGLVYLTDGFYTGWFYATGRDGKTHVAFRNRKIDDMEDYRHIYFRPYFLLDERKASELDLLLKSPLSEEEVDALRNFPHERAHPLYRNLISLSLEDFCKFSRAFFDNYHDRARELLKENKSEERTEYGRENLLKIAIANDGMAFLYRGALSDIKKNMEVTGITVFPLTEEGCVVAYRVGNGIRYRTYPLPHTHIKHFQRYRILGERPMTFEEFRQDYLKMVNNNPSLFRE